MTPVLALSSVPRAARVLGFAGLLPFVWGVLTMLWPPAAELTMRLLGPRFLGPYVALYYGTIILAFMSGVLWGFATRAEGRQAAIGYALSVVPALWVFLFAGNGPVSTAINLMAGFLAVLAIDLSFWQQGLTPRWWMALRLPLTAGVIACLAVIAWAG